MPKNVNRIENNSAGVGVKPWIILDADALGNISYNIELTATATFTLEATLVRVTDKNQSVAAGQVFTVVNAVDLTATQAGVIQNTPLSALRINQTLGAGSTSLTVVSGG